MKRLSQQNGRKSLEGQAFLYINNNSSFHHKGARMPTHTRARETPCDVLQYCGIRFWLFSASHFKSVLGAICEPRIGPVSRPGCVLRQIPIATSNALCARFGAFGAVCQTGTRNTCLHGSSQRFLRFWGAWERSPTLREFVL
jgi:hypothetical protein